MAKHKPVNPRPGDWWIDESSKARRIYRYNGIRWIEFNPTNMKIMDDTPKPEDPADAYDRAMGIL